jgi:hypothetical protein
MIKYEDLVEYTKRNHIKWSTDLFDVLRGFFESYSQQYSPPPLSASVPSIPFVALVENRRIFFIFIPHFLP